MSDGDVLRRRSNQCAVPDSCDGYMSEGGTAVYVQRMYEHHNGSSPRSSPHAQ